MFDVKRMLKRQARWQHLRANLSWTEKLRMAEILREAALAMTQSRRKSDQQTDSETDDRRKNGQLIDSCISKSQYNVDEFVKICVDPWLKQKRWHSKS